MSAITNKYPLFTIITVTLNNFVGLKRTQQSVDEQTSQDFEWIVIDGESEDQTIDFLRELRSNTRNTQFPFTFYSQKDDGIYDAMNIGISKAKGRYIIFLNAGDSFANHTVLEEITPITEKKPDFIYGDALEPDEDGTLHNKKARRYKDAALGMFTHHQSMFYNRLKIRDEKLHYSLLYLIASDYDFTLRFLQKAQKCSYYAKPICIFEQGGISQQNASLGRREQFVIREKLGLVSQARNVQIYLMQYLSWMLKNKAPALYRWLKSREQSNE